MYLCKVFDKYIVSQYINSLGFYDQTDDAIEPMAVFNTDSPGDRYVEQWTRSSLVQEMACLLFRT